MKRLKIILLNMALFVATGALLLAAGEAALRLAGVQPPRFVSYDEYRDMNKLYMPNAVARWCGPLGAVMDFDNQVRTNDLTFHDTTHTPEKAASVFRILVLGDSYVEAHQVPLEDTFFKQLQRRLNADPSVLPPGKTSAELIAMGRSGNGAVRELVTLREHGLAYHPDLVMCFLTEQNDFNDDWNHYRYMTGQDTYKHVNLRPRDTVQEKVRLYEKLLIFKGSRLNRWIAFKLTQMLLKKSRVEADADAWKSGLGIYALEGAPLFKDEAAKWEEAFRVTAQSYLSMNALARGAGAGFVAVLNERRATFEKDSRAYLAGLFPGLEHQVDFNYPSRRFTAVMNRYDVPVLDLSPVFRAYHERTGEKGNFAHDGHWRRRGHELVAGALYDYLVNDYFKNKPTAKPEENTHAENAVAENVIQK
ncbi:MAG: SGNH/GDSL hydrolase family protein [Candidatus Omnitrophica bacterium]|nr:SGNH/GDSL hydrolase family protein [Candidatus Omnitrophota bacterium]